ncbi:MAG: DUF2267 domain-containing protein [Fodinibius sp.]|nr:DUF2267 domain-containing protein [Fodinibius sp.]
MKKEEFKEVHWFERLEADIADADASTPNITSEKWKQLRGELGFERDLIPTYRWVYEMGLSLGISSQYRLVYRVLLSALYALRDRLPPEEVFQFAAQLPQHLRGLFFAQYTISGKPEKLSAAHLLKRIEEAGSDQLQKDATEIFAAVLQLLSKHVSSGEMDHIYATMPEDIKALWNEAQNS